ncbi:MAG: exodeoxyribonuclease VII small subunit [Kiritimatiellae bacterium]|nr:exodeoxyribonuclease VII small subunit [Kiritimatiellia bacterium]
MSEEKEMSFEEALEKLEKLAQQMESGNLGLEAMVGAYEEGQKLIKTCTDKLNAVERRIEVLVKGEDGAVKAVPFEEE